MSNVIYSTNAVRWGSGWEETTVRFEETDILAHHQLNSYGFYDEPSNPGIGVQRYAFAYLITANTPHLPSLPWPNPDKQADSAAWLTTSWVTFSLQVWNEAQASSFGLVHDRSATHTFSTAELKLDFAVYDEVGAVVGTSRHVLLPGGEAPDFDAIQHDLLARERSRSEATLDVVRVDLSELPKSASYAIDLNTRQPIPVG